MSDTETDWSRYLLGASSSGDLLRQAVVRNFDQVARLRAELAVARARVAELEAGEVRTNWGVRYGPNDADSYGRDEASARRAAAGHSLGGALVRRECRTGPWVEVQP